MPSRSGFSAIVARGIDSNYLVWDNYSSESYTKSHASSRYHQPRHDHEHHRRSLAKRQRQQKCDTSAYIRAYKNPSTMSPETGYTVGPSLRPSIQPPAQCVPPHISLQREKYLSDKQHGRRARHYGFGAAIGGTRSLKVPFSRPLASSASNLFSFATSPITTHEAGHTGQYNTIKRHSSQDEESDSSSLLMSENLVYDMISHRQQQYPLLRRSLHSPVSSLQTMASPFSVSSFTYPSGSVTQRPSTSAAATRSLALASSAPPSSLSPLDTKRSDEAMMMKGLKKLGLVARHNKYPPRATRDAKNGTPSMKPREGAIGADRSNANNTIIHTGSASDADAGTRAGRVRHSRDKDDAMYDNTNPSPRCVNNLQLYMNNLPVSIANTNTNMTAQAYTPSYEISSDGTRSLHALQPSANSEAHPNMNMRLSRKMNIHKKTNDDRFAASLATELGLAGFVQGGRSFVASVKQRRAEEREKKLERYRRDQEIERRKAEEAEKKRKRQEDIERMKRELRRRPAITKRHSMVSFNDTFYKRHRQQHAQDTEQLRDHSNDGVNRLNQLDYNWQSKQKQLFAGTVNTKDGNGGTLVSNNDQKFSDSGVSSSYNNGVKGSHTSRDSPGKRGGKENQRLGTDNEGNMSATSSNTYSDGDESSSSQAQSLYHTQQEQRKSSTIQMQRPELMRMKTYNPVMREISTPASSSQAAGSEPNTSLQTNVDTNTTDEGGETSAVVSRDHGAGDLDFDCSAQSQSMNEGEWRSKSDGDGDSSASESEGNSNNESDHAGDRRKRYTIARRGRLSSSQSSSSSTSSKSNSLQKTPASKFRKSYHRSHPQHRNKNISDHVANKSDVDRSSNDIASGGTEKEEVPTSTTHTDKHTFDDASDVGRATTEMVTKASNQTIKTKTNDKTDSKKSRTAKASGVLLSPGRSKARLSRSLSSNKGKKAGLSRRKKPISTNTKKGRGTNNSDSMSGRSSKVDVAKPRKTLSLMSDIRQMRQSRAQFDIDHFQKHQQMEKEKATKERKERMRKEEEEKKKWEGSKRRTWSFAKFNSVLNDGLVELQEIQAQEKDMERDLAHDYDFDYSDDADEVVIGRRGSSLNAVTEQNQGRKSGKSHKPRRTGRSKRKKVLDEEDDGFYEIPSFDLDTDDANSSEALRHGTDNKAGRGYQQMSGGGSGWSSGSETDEDFQIDEEDNGYSGNFFRPSNDVVQTRRTGIKRKPKTPKKTAPNTDMNLRARQSLSTSTTASSSLSSVRRKLPTTDVSGAAKKSRSKIEKSK